MRGVFITLEGIDGSGKTTQAEILRDRLVSVGEPVLLTREPGGTRVGQALRSLCLDGNDAIAWETEMLLMAADRAQHVFEVIKPALERGNFVICDRFVDSSVAYQGYGSEKSIVDVLAVNTIATQQLTPDLTIFLAVPPEAQYERPGQSDRIERRGLEYYQRVYQGFFEIARHNSRVVVLEVSGLSREVVANLIWQTCISRYPHLNLSGLPGSVN